MGVPPNLSPGAQEVPHVLHFLYPAIVCSPPHRGSREHTDFLFFEDLFIIYLFYFVLAASVLVAARGIFIEARGIFRCDVQALRCGARASLWLWHAGFLFSSCGAQAPGCVGSVVVVCGVQSTWAL